MLAEAPVTFPNPQLIVYGKPVEWGNGFKVVVDGGNIRITSRCIKRQPTLVFDIDNDVDLQESCQAAAAKSVYRRKDDPDNGFGGGAGKQPDFIRVYKRSMRRGTGTGKWYASIKSA